MSTSLLLALLEAHEYRESDRSGEYNRWAGGDPDRKKLMLDELYDVLRSTTDMGVRESGALGTVLARTLTDDPKAGLPEAAKRLRAAMRQEILRRFDALIAKYPPLNGGNGDVLPVGNELSRLREENQRLRKALNALTSESK